MPASGVEPRSTDGGVGRSRSGPPAGWMGSSISPASGETSYQTSPTHRPSPLRILSVYFTPFPKESDMAYVVTDNCFDCVFTDCVAVCPVDCYADDR
jgi:hypothetical protein